MKIEQILLKFRYLFALMVLMFSKLAQGEILCATDGTCPSSLICDITMENPVCKLPDCIANQLSSDCPNNWKCLIYDENHNYKICDNSENAESCAVATKGTCRPLFLLPCEKSIDCGTETFFCGIEPGEVSGECLYPKLSCTENDDSSCPDGLSCRTKIVQNDPECSGFVADDSWTCNYLPPETISECHPPDIEVVGVFSAGTSENQGNDPENQENSDIINTDSNSIDNKSFNGNDSNENNCQVNHFNIYAPSNWFLILLTIIFMILKINIQKIYSRK